MVIFKLFNIYLLNCQFIYLKPIFIHKPTGTMLKTLNYKKYYGWFFLTQKFSKIPLVREKNFAKISAMLNLRSRIAFIPVLKILPYKISLTKDFKTKLIWQ